MGGDLGPGGTSGGSGGTAAETFTCATAMFSPTGFTGGIRVFNAYVLTLTPAARGHVGVLQLEPLGGDTAPGTAPPPQTLEISGVVGRDAIDVTFQGGSIRVAPLAGAAPGVLDGDARFDQPFFGLPFTVDSLAVACWAAASVPRFRYDLASGRCVDAAGVEGRQPVTVPMLRETRDGECATLTAGRHVEPEPLIRGQVVLNEIDVGYPSLVGWNLRGAALAGGGLYFAMLLDADLRGTDLTGFMPGYHAITATIDAHTTGIDGIHCIVGNRTSDRWACCTVGGVTCE